MEQLCNTNKGLPTKRPTIIGRIESKEIHTMRFHRKYICFRLKQRCAQRELVIAKRVECALNTYKSANISNILYIFNIHQHRYTALACLFVYSLNSQMDPSIFCFSFSLVLALHCNGIENSSSYVEDTLFFSNEFYKSQNAFMQKQIYKASS